MSCRQALTNTPQDVTSDIYFINDPIQTTLAYQVYESAYKDEHAKIAYLTNLVRYSPYKFFRNGMIVTGEGAAQWLEYKINKFPEDCTTVEDFIEKVASFSRRSGREYTIIVDTEHCYPIKQVYYNELRRLSAHEKKTAEHVTPAHEGSKEPLSAYRSEQ